MILQLNPPLPLETTKGAGWAHVVIDYGPEGALPWLPSPIDSREPSRHHESNTSDVEPALRRTEL